MKKAVAVLTLFCMIAGVNFSVEAALNLRQKIGDVVKGRKSNEDTRGIDKVISNIKGLGSNFGSSGSAQFKYVSDKFLITDSDLSFLMAYSSFARNSEIFFSLFESVLSKIRTGYTTSLGAQNSLEKTNSEKKARKQESKDEASRINMQRCLEVLTSNGFQAIQANLQCSSIILLTVLQKTNVISVANQKTVQKQIAALCKKCSSEKFNYIYETLPGSLSSAADVAGFSEDISEKTESLIRSISLIKNVLDILNRYVNGENFSNGNRQAQIREILRSTDYYWGTQTGGGIYENNGAIYDEDDGDFYEEDDDY